MANRQLTSVITTVSNGRIQYSSDLRWIFLGIPKFERKQNIRSPNGLKQSISTGPTHQGNPIKSFKNSERQLARSPPIPIQRHLLRYLKPTSEISMPQYREFQEKLILVSFLFYCNGCMCRITAIRITRSWGGKRRKLKEIFVASVLVNFKNLLLSIVININITRLYIKFLDSLLWKFSWTSKYYKRKNMQNL